MQQEVEDRKVYLATPGGEMLAWYISKGMVYCGCGVEAERMDHVEGGHPYVLTVMRPQASPYGIFQCAEPARHGGFCPLWVNPEPKGGAE